MAPTYDHHVPKRVLVTRAAEDAPALAHALGRAGFEPVVVPLVQRHWNINAVAEVAENHPTVDWVLITSGTAAEVIATACPGAWRHARWAAVGPASASRLRQLGLPVYMVPPRATAGDLVAALGPDLQGCTIVYPRADLASPATAEDLRLMGATVVDVVAYINTAPRGHVERLAATLPVHGTTLLSGSAARRIAEATSDHAGLGQVVAIGPSTAAAARDLGLPVHVVAEPHSIRGVVEALARLLV